MINLNHLGHKLIKCYKFKNNINGDYVCDNCGLIINYLGGADESDGFGMKYAIYKNRNWVKPTLTCEEEIIKNIIE